MNVLADVAVSAASTDDETKRGRRQREQLDGGTALLQAGFEAATSKDERRRILRGQGLAVVVVVPASDWVRPMSGYLETLYDAEHFARDRPRVGSADPQQGNDLVRAALSRSENVLGITHDIALLPSLLVDAADVRVIVPFPCPATIGAAMKLCLRGRVDNLPEGLSAGLDFGRIVSALRPKSTPTEAVERLRSMSSTKAQPAPSSASSLPRLEEATFYGVARDWGMSLARDVARAKSTGDWSHADKGCVFFGDPGTGKTVLCRMIAEHCGLPIVETSMTDLLSTGGHLHKVVKSLRELFEQARKSGPGIIFFDELDAFPDRAKLAKRNREWFTAVLTEFLIRIAGAPPGTIFLGATNRLTCDPALLRPGRFERTIEIKPPQTAEDLAAVVRFHLGKDLPDDDIASVARMGLGATAAVAFDWVRQARRFARDENRTMRIEDLAMAIAPPDTRDRSELERTSIHEAGHAVIASCLAVGIRDVSLISRGDTGGRMTMHSNMIGNALLSGRAVIERLAIVMLAGRTAELVAYGKASIGAGAGGTANSDLAVVSRIVASVHASFGLGDTLLYRDSVENIERVLAFDPALRHVVETDIRRLAAQTEALVRERWRDIEAVSSSLLARRYLTAEEVASIMNQRVDKSLASE